MSNSSPVLRNFYILLAGIAVGGLTVAVLGYAGGYVTFPGSAGMNGKTEETPELAPYMAQLQRFSHKLGLSIEHRNDLLATFYLEEMEEVVEDIEDEFPRYEDQPVGSLTSAMVLPELRALEESIDNKQWPKSSSRFEKLIQGCNQCHASTERGFIHIKPTVEDNPYLQVFEPQSDSANDSTHPAD